MKSIQNYDFAPDFIEKVVGAAFIVSFIFNMTVYFHLSYYYLMACSRIFLSTGMQIFLVGLFFRLKNRNRVRKKVEERIKELENKNKNKNE